MRAIVVQDRTGRMLSFGVQIGLARGSERNRHGLCIFVLTAPAEGIRFCLSSERFPGRNGRIKMSNSNDTGNRLHFRVSIPHPSLGRLVEYCTTTSLGAKRMAAAMSGGSPWDGGGMERATIECRGVVYYVGQTSGKGWKWTEVSP